MHTYSLREYILAKLNLLPTAIHDVFPATLLGRTVAIAVRKGVFESMRDQPQSVDEIARRTSLPLMSIELVLDALTATGYLKKRRHKYSLTLQARKWLVRSSPHFIGNFLAYIEILHSHWMYLEETLNNGRPPLPYTEMFTEKEWEIYTYGMRDLARLMLPGIFPKLKIPSAAKSLLDIGGSHGLYSIELCKTHSNLHATIADLPQVIRITETILREEHLQHRMSVLPFDISEGGILGKQYDIILAFNIIHAFTAERNRDLFSLIGSSLHREGTVYILDQLKTESGRGLQRLLPIMVGINLLNETGGNVYTLNDIKSWCENAGLHRVRFHRLRFPGVYLISAGKS